MLCNIYKMQILTDLLQNKSFKLSVSSLQDYVHFYLCGITTVSILLTLFREIFYLICITSETNWKFKSHY